MAFTVANVLRRHARDIPEHEALVFGNTRLTFSELHERTSRAAQALIATGVQPGGRVGILMRNCCEYYELVLACSKIDAIAVALNWRLAPAELEAILDDCGASVVVTDPESAGLVPENSEGRIITLGDEYEQWLAEASAEDPGVEAEPDSVMIILYSSGTTGLPKGIMLTNQNFSFTEKMATGLFRMTPDAVHLVVSPLFHIGGIGTGITAMLLGGRTVLAKDATPEGLLETIEQERVTHAFFVPAIIQRVTELLEEKPRELPDLQLVYYGGAPMTEPLLRRALPALGCGFLGCYGMTETAGTVSALWPEEHEPDGGAARLLRSVGRSLPWLDIKIANPDTGEERPPDEVGEIWVRSDANMAGYWHKPEATAATLVDGWVRTGDGGYRDEDGYIFLKDRIKDMIISGGENIYPAEVENALAAHPSVSEVAVIGVPHEKWGETPKAIIVLRPGTEATEDELKDFTNERLARYKCPTSFEFRDGLPRNPAGKVLKHVLRAPYWQTVEPTA